MCLSDLCHLKLAFSLYITLFLPSSTSHEKQMGCLSKPSLKNHYHLSSLPDLSLNKPGVHLASKSSEPSINQSIKPSFHLFWPILHPIPPPNADVFQTVLFSCTLFFYYIHTEEFGRKSSCWNVKWLSKRKKRRLW